MDQDTDKRIADSLERIAGVLENLSDVAKPKNSIVREIMENKAFFFFLVVGALYLLMGLYFIFFGTSGKVSLSTEQVTWYGTGLTTLGIGLAIITFAIARFEKK